MAASELDGVLGAAHGLCKVRVGELRGFHELLIIVNGPELASVVHTCAGVGF